MDFKVRSVKTQKSVRRQYYPAMKNAREILADRVSGLVGDGLRFKNAPELAQRAMTMGLIENTESFTRQINRIKKAEMDPQLNTIEHLARAAGVSVAWLLGGDANEGLSESARHLIKQIADLDRDGGPRAGTVFKVLTNLLEVTDTSAVGERLAK